MTPATQINAASSPDSRFTIAIRRYQYLGLRLVQLALGSSRALAKPAASVMIWPPPQSSGELIDVLNRLACGLPQSAGGARPTILVPNLACLDLTDLDATLSVNGSDPYLDRDFLSKCAAVPEAEYASALRRADRVVVWRAGECRKPSMFRFLGKIVLCDPRYYLGYEPYNYARLRFLMMTEQERTLLRTQSVARFEAMRDVLRGRDKAHVIVTGPSLTEALRTGIDTRGSVVIVCNSIVKNQEILAALKPDILVFADPVFHYGVSRYAAEFRRNALRTLIDYPNCRCVIPEIFAPFLAAHFPQVADRIIGMPYLSGRSDYVFPTADAFCVKGTDNIMTLLMLPLAFALAREVFIAGADGRQKSESYYWKHNPAVQFGDLMDDAFRAHPSFTRDRSYEDYYDRHCSVVAAQIKKGERDKAARTVSLTPSFIPALAARHSSAT